MRLLDDVKIATVFLTRLPVRIRGDVPPGRIAEAMWVFPVIGAAHGAFGGLVYWGAGAVGLNGLAAAALALAAMLWATGAFHEDGLADTFDGLGGGLTRERKLEILRDSRIGTYGASALILGLMLRAGAILSFDGLGAVAALAASGAWSRSLAVFVACLLPHAQAGGVSKDAGQPPLNVAVLALSVAAALGVLALAFGGFGPWAALAVALSAAAAGSAALTAQRQLGGQTGDILGATQQIAEIAFLLALAAAVSSA